MLTKTLLTIITALFLFSGNANAYNECRIGTDPVTPTGHILQAGEEVFWPNGDYLVTGMKGGTGKTYGPCVIKPTTADKNGNRVYFIRRAGRLVLTGNCDNPFQKAELLSQPIASTGRPTAQAAFHSGAGERDVTLAINLWNHNNITHIFHAEPGYQSIDRGREVRAACDQATGINPPCQASGQYTFKIEFQNISSPNIIPVTVVNGEGAVTLPAEALRGARLCIESPFRKPKIDYPPSGTLCSRPGKIDDAMAKGRNTIFYHFVIN